MGGRRNAAAIDLARTAARAPKIADGRPLDILAKAAAAARRIQELRGDLDRVQDLAHQAQVREALVRNELALALGQALLGRAAAEAAARDAAARAYLDRARPRPLRPASAG